MGGATARIFTLISTPVPLLRSSHPSSLLFLRRLPSPLFLSPRKCCSHFHTQPNPTPLPSVPPNPWPEWSGFLDRVSRSGYSNKPSINKPQFDTTLGLGHGFLKEAAACLAFAEDHPSVIWSLSKEDIEVVVENVSPDLFMDAAGVTIRMRSFLAGGMDDVLECDKPSTVDLVKYLLSYIHMANLSFEDTPLSSRVESSVRKLFGELVKSSRLAESVAPIQNQNPKRYGQVPRSYGKNIEMKRGDWICQRCSFMNFAKNLKCLQCEELRPKRFVTGGEWECPQCDFFNFGRNVVCLRCDCKRPAAKQLQSSTITSGLGVQMSFVQGQVDRQLGGNKGQQQNWFTKITQLETSSGVSSALVDEDFPESMQAGEKSYVGTTRNFSVGGKPDSVLMPENSATTFLSNDSSGQFTQNRDTSQFGISGSAFPQDSHLTAASPGSDNNPSLSDQLSSERPVRQMENNVSDQTEKSERWFKKVVDLHEVEDLPSSISDEDFPEVMPMRKGESRFVVSKKKDRSLTSPMYKRRMAMEQAGNSNYVPFVPFPPGYFSKDKPQQESNSADTPSISASLGEVRTAVPHNSNSVITANMLTGSISAGRAAERNEDGATNSFEGLHNMDQIPLDFDARPSSAGDAYSKAVSKNNLSSDASAQSSKNPEAMDSWRGKNLEGSAVKEPDPLDMSEEAKAERWFRRAAQIKDISELSQIPDEDFPSIMPMRKGVNRFVVSKRKTPLERRLTSSQYRRNLPVVNSESDPARKETESS